MSDEHFIEFSAQDCIDRIKEIVDETLDGTLAEVEIKQMLFLLEGSLTKKETGPPELPPQFREPPRPVRLGRIHPNYPTYPGWIRLYPCPPDQHYFSQPPVLPQPEEGCTLMAQVRNGRVEFSVDEGPGAA